MIEIKTAERAALADWDKNREPLFSIDGTEYTIPVEIPPFIALQAMERTRTEGEVPATAWLLERILGTDAYKALITCPYVGRGELIQIREIVRRKTFGVLEEDSEGKG